LKESRPGQAVRSHYDWSAQKAAEKAEPLLVETYHLPNRYRGLAIRALIGLVLGI
jgi:hypothetical protein